jgi:hypothetical protein
MKNKLCLRLVDLLGEYDIEGSYNEFLEFKSLTKHELVEYIKASVSASSENIPVKAYAFISPNPITLSENDYIIYSTENIIYKDLLIAIIICISYINEIPEKVSFLLSIYSNLKMIDEKSSNRFKDDLANYLYYEYAK